ncbi:MULTISPECIES: DUF1254 domain-containing protein [unclassified Synechocystis]|uniref:DUF1254 domain-containing protein n=1 Tax=unclassified Synechocystis TaxID=2640012 RepID=UPI0003FC4DAF|nr:MULTISPECIES: DUF1254 domain-containing protein [unclassified Synechocystis]AIE74916.1 putative exported protein [Synechocystis sp. PCC 6714]MCT0253370.1 DUF1254 domain-containing protein [Synechocystis sp. CS-94]
MNQPEKILLNLLFFTIAAPLIFGYNHQANVVSALPEYPTKETVNMTSIEETNKISTVAKAATLTPEEAQKIAIQAYTYGYSLVTTEITRLAFTNTTKPNPATLQAPLNQIVNQPAYPPATYKGVTAPNADTLYSVGFIDVSQEPMVFSYPDMGKRFFLFPIYDAWTNVISVPGSRTTGGQAQTLLITGPSWRGEVPFGMTQVKSPTNNLFIIGRVYADGTASDFAKVHGLQKEFNLVPLSQHGKSYTPPTGKTGGPYTPKDIVRDLILNMSPPEYFNLMAKQMAIDPPTLPRDQAVVEKMAKLGIVPGQPFRFDQLDPKVQEALTGVGETVLESLEAWQKTGGKIINGWSIPGAAGSYSTDYLARAAISAFGWGANLPQDAVYPTAKVDGTGQSLVGNNVYKMHFKKGETPPVDGFWSITMYDEEFYFYPNPLNKLTLSPRDNLQYNTDGSLDLYFSHQQPQGVPESNWLPAPQEKFILMMRLYWPKENPPSILPPNNPSWNPPGIEQIK